MAIVHLRHEHVHAFADKVQCLHEWKLDDECVPTDAGDCFPNTCGDGVKDAWEQCVSSTSYCTSC